MISERNNTWSERIRIEKFRYHNAQWLQMIDSQQLGQEDDEDEDNELPPYLNTEYLSTAVVPPLSSSESKPVDESEIMTEKELDCDYFNTTAEDL